MIRRRPPRCAPRLLELEDRSVPAGNVTASVINLYGSPTLQVFGDDAANNIVLQGNGEGVIEVRGVNTTVNGGNKAVTFSNLQRLIVDVADGNDTVRSHGLAVGEIIVRAGAGDDTVQLVGTTGGNLPFFDGETGLSLSVDGDGSVLAHTETNGNDTITITGTNVRGASVSIATSGDSAPEFGAHDAVTLSDTTIVAEPSVYGYAFISIQTYGFEPSGPGDDILINNLDVTADVVGSVDMYFYIFGGEGDDHVRLNNVDMQFNTTPRSGQFDYNYLDWYVDGFGGRDIIECNNININAVMPYGQGLFNQLSFGHFAEVVRMTNVSTQAGGFHEEGVFGSFSGNFAGIVAIEADLRNVSITSAEGGADFFLASPELTFGDAATDESYTLVNVTVSHSPEITALGYPALLSIFTGGGNDQVTIVNSTLQGLYLELGEGDDDLTLTNNTFITMAADLGDGDDSATLFNNTATESIAVNGGSGIDTLFAWNNLAPMFVFEDFEL